MIVNKAGNENAFGGMTLFDHAINASLVLPQTEVPVKQDKAGLITFAEKVGQFFARR